jgi:ADP-ribosylglycohydrolase
MSKSQTSRVNLPASRNRTIPSHFWAPAFIATSFAWLLAANLGDDADTTAAVFGQLGGAFYGVDAIPAKWLAKLAMRELIEQMADDLLGRSLRIKF